MRVFILNKLRGKMSFVIIEAESNLICSFLVELYLCLTVLKDLICYLIVSLHLEMCGAFVAHDISLYALDSYKKV